MLDRWKYIHDLDAFRGWIDGYKMMNGWSDGWMSGRMVLSESQTGQSLRKSRKARHRWVIPIASKLTKINFDNLSENFFFFSNPCIPQIQHGSYLWE